MTSVLVGIPGARNGQNRRPRQQTPQTALDHHDADRQEGNRSAAARAAAFQRRTGFARSNVPAGRSGPTRQRLPIIAKPPQPEYQRG